MYVCMHACMYVCQNVTKFETLDIHISAVVFFVFCMLISLYTKYILRDFEKILSAQKKLLTNSKTSVFYFTFLTDLFKVGTQVEHRDEKPFAKFKQNLPWNCKEN